MFVDLKNPYSENEYITKGNLILQSNLQIKGNPYQGINGIFHRPKQTISQFLQKYKTTPITEAILRKKNGTGGISLSEFRLYCKATVIKTVWYWHKDRNTDQWNKIESPEVNPSTYGHLIFGKGRTYIQRRKDNLFNKWLTHKNKLKSGLNS